MDNESTPTKMGMSKMVIGAAAAIIIILAVGAALLLKQNSTQQSEVTTSETVTEDVMEKTEDTAMEEGEAMEDEAMMEEGEVTVVNVGGGSFTFEPNVIRAKKGETIRVVFSANDLMHDFVIDDLNVGTELTQAGETSEVEFTADEAGEFEFYCSVGNHRAQGMVGTLIIEE